MAKKTTTPGLTLREELRALDLKQRDFLQQLPDDVRKKFSPYLMLRYAASVEGSAELQQYYLQATNERVNKNFFALRNPELQWLACTTVSPGLGVQRHYWITSKSTGRPGNSALREKLSELWPHANDADITLFLQINDPKTVKQWLTDQGVISE